MTEAAASLKNPIDIEAAKRRARTGESPHSKVLRHDNQSGSTAYLDTLIYRELVGTISVMRSKRSCSIVRLGIWR